LHRSIILTKNRNPIDGCETPNMPRLAHPFKAFFAALKADLEWPT
jgi:hypothetical protein